MQIDDSHLDNTPDLIAKIRKLREAAEKEMNKFTTVADYDVRRVVGQKPKSDLAEEPSSVAPAGGRARKKTDKSSADQTAIEFSSAPAEHDDDGEDQ